MSETLIARRESVEVEETPPVGDEELLRRFVASGDDRAFAALVARHGPLVMAVCRRVLCGEQDAEDAFQAAFLVLARKASSVRHAPSLPAWLHRTAHRIALRVRAAGARRREQPLEAEAMIAAETLSHIAAEYDQSVLDEELNRLPEKYRLPLFLCAMEGKSREEAANQLGWSLGSLKGRLERGRQLLRRRLMLRGVSLSIGLAAVTYSQQAAQAAVPASLVASTAQAGVQYAAGQCAVGYVSENALALANGSFHLMSLTTVKIAACTLAAAGALTWGVSTLPAPALAGGENEGGIVLQGALTGDAGAEHFVTFLADEERDESADGSEERAPRRDGEREGERRGPRDGEGPPHTGPRDGDDAPRTGPRDGDGPAKEGRRDGDRRGPREGEGDRRAPREGAGDRGGIDGFRPQSQREEALYRIILQLQREVADLRRQVQQLRGADDRREGVRERDGDRDAPREGERDGDRSRDGERDDAPERDGDAPRDGERERDRPRDVDRDE